MIWGNPLVFVASCVGGLPLGDKARRIPNVASGGDTTLTIAIRVGIPLASAGAIAGGVTTNSTQSPSIND